MDIFGFFFQKKILIIVGTMIVLIVGILAGSGMDESGDLVEIVRVIDGDTIELENGEVVRYIGIDAPEMTNGKECFAEEAFLKNEELVEGKMARLEKDVSERDKYGRLLRYVWIDDVLINLELVKEGFAYSWSYPPDVKYQDDLTRAQDEARNAERGLWSGCEE